MYKEDFDNIQLQQRPFSIYRRFSLSALRDLSPLGSISIISRGPRTRTRKLLIFSRVDKTKA